MKRFTSIILISIILFSSLGLSTFSADTLDEYPSDYISVDYKGVTEEISEEKIICKATIEDDFEDDSVIVVFKNNKSKKLENHTRKSFSDISANSVTDLTSRTKGKIENQRNKKAQAKSVFEINASATTDEMQIDENKFHQIVKIDLGIKSKENVLACVKKLEARDDVLMACPNYFFKPTGNVTPNDPCFPSTYKYGGQWGSRIINLPSAWSITKGSSSVKVGVLDSGIERTHDDLKNRYNSSLSKDFTGGNSPGTDAYGHGTQVAGIIGAQADNSVGVAGVCWNVSLVSLKVVKLNDDGEYTADLGLVANAIDYANEKNIPILNFSSCGENEHNADLDVIWSNYSGLFVCSTTNERENVTNQTFAHQEYISANTIVVTATNQNDELLEFYDEDGELKGASYSKTKVHLAAPGDDIWTTGIGNDYVCTYGTSMAAPFVTGVAALLKSKYPGMDAKALKYYIEKNVDSITILDEKVRTGGRLNADDALRNLESFTVSYDANGGGGGTMSDTTVIYGCSTSLRKNTYSRAGYEFKGWYIERADSNLWYYEKGSSRRWFEEGKQDPGYVKVVYKDGTKVLRTTTNGKTVIMHAKWEKKFNIEFIGNNSTSGSINSVTLSTGTTYYLPSTGFTRSNCTLEHWYLKNSSEEHYCSNGTSYGWFAIGSKPSGYTRVDFVKGAPLTVDDIVGTDYNETIYMCAYWKPSYDLLGDINMDDEITETDVTRMQKYLSGEITFVAYEERIADVNFNGSVTVQDVTMMQKYLAGIIDEFGA